MLVDLEIYNPEQREAVTAECTHIALVQAKQISWMTCTNGILKFLSFSTFAASVPKASVVQKKHPGKPKHQ